MRPGDQERGDGDPDRNVARGFDGQPCSVGRSRVGGARDSESCCRRPGVKEVAPPINMVATASSPARAVPMLLALCPLGEQRGIEPLGVHIRRGVDRGDTQLTVPGVGEAVSGRCGGDKDVPGGRDDPGSVDFEVGLPGVDDEQLGIRVSMQAGTCARPVIDQEQGDRQATVLCANEPLSLWRSAEFASSDEQFLACCRGRGRRCCNVWGAIGSRHSVSLRHQAAICPTDNDNETER